MNSDIKYQSKYQEKDHKTRKRKEETICTTDSKKCVD